MSMDDIHRRLGALTQAAQARRLMCAPDFAGAVGGADIDFMTKEERDERHALLMRLPTSFEEAQAAKARIQARIALRKARRAQTAVIAT